MSNVQQIIEKLSAKYPSAQCELDYESDFELLVAVILSAQCTDKRVNEVTKKLFKKVNTPQQFAEMKQEDLEKEIFSCGFYHNKAKNIINASKDICNKFGGLVPSTMQELMALSGVGRKTANVVLAVAFGEQTIAVDTHVFRVSRRLGLSDGTTPEAVERDLLTVVPHDMRTNMHHLLIFHGRYCCKSHKPDCGNCPVADLCKEKDKGEKLCL